MGEFDVDASMSARPQHVIVAWSALGDLLLLQDLLSAGSPMKKMWRKGSRWYQLNARDHPVVEVVEEMNLRGKHGLSESTVVMVCG